MIEKFFEWQVVCTPMSRGPIRNVILYVEAESRKEAELIVLDKAHKFFDQDMNYIWGRPNIIYKQVL